MSPRLKKTASYLLKTTVFILVVWYCYKLFTDNKALKDFEHLIQSTSPATIWSALLLVFVLMMANWSIESLKWRFICGQFQPISLRKAIESVLCGLAWAIFTPNRIGEYGGRVLFLRPRKRVFGVIGMLIGAVSQMVITNILGSIAVCWFVGVYLDLNIVIYVLICLLCVVYVAFFFLLFFNIGVINRLLLKIRFLKKYKRFFDLLLRYKRFDLKRIFIYSLSRYIIFTTQYCVLMQVIIPDLPIIEMILMVFILFFVQSALPSLDLLDIGVRTVTASFFFSFITPHIVAVMSIVACVWFFNLIIPAIIGSVFVFKINFFDTRNN